MTRINLINPKELTDQHLIAEYRELPRVFGAVRKKIENKKEIKVGEKYKMGTGHVLFFYDKLLFLEKRYNLILKECKNRNFKIKFSNYNIDDIEKIYKKDFFPEQKDIKISKDRILEKIKQKPKFYKYYGKPIDETNFGK